MTINQNDYDLQCLQDLYIETEKLNNDLCSRIIDNQILAEKLKKIILMSNECITKLNSIS